MKAYQNQPITAVRIDPATGTEYTFTAYPLEGGVNDLLLKPELTLREYTIRLFWAGISLGTQSNFFHLWEDMYPNLAAQMRSILPLFDQCVHQVVFDVENFRKTDIGTNYDFFFRKPELESSVPGASPSQLFIAETYNEIIKSPAVQFAVLGYYELQTEKPDESNISESTDPDKPSDGPTKADSKKPKSRTRRTKQDTPPENNTDSESQPNSEAAVTRSLFSNSKDQTEIEFSMPKMITDGLARGLKGINKKIIEQQYVSSGKHDAARRASVTFKGTKSEVINGKKESPSTEIAFDKEALGIKTAEQCANQLIKIKNPKVMQCFFALWKEASLRQNPTFVDTPLSTIMAHVLKPTNECLFNTADRRAFSSMLTYLSHMTIAVAQIVYRPGKQGKSTPFLEKIPSIPVFQMKALYSVKKAYQKLGRDELREEHFDQTVINRFSGQLLPMNPELFATRANMYTDSLLRMDANKDAKAILVGFTVQTRFNQNTDKERPVDMSRSTLIELCDYEKTDATNSTEANKQIRKVLEKLIAHGIIGSYGWRTDEKGSSKIRMTPPTSLKLA